HVHDPAPRASGGPFDGLPDPLDAAFQARGVVHGTREVSRRPPGLQAERFGARVGVAGSNMVGSGNGGGGGNRTRVRKSVPREILQACPAVWFSHASAPTGGISCVPALLLLVRSPRARHWTSLRLYGGRTSPHRRGPGERRCYLGSESQLSV